MRVKNDGSKIKKRLASFLAATLIMGMVSSFAVTSFAADSSEADIIATEATEATQPSTEPIPSETQPTEGGETDPVPEYGWEQSGDNWKYTDSEGNEYKNDLFVIEENKYLFDKKGVLLTGIQKYNGKTYCFSDEGTSPKEGLGAMLNYEGFKEINSNIYYFNANKNYAVTGWKSIEGKAFYFTQNGKMKTGLVKIGKNIFNFASSGKLGKKGAMSTGWKTISKSKFYFNPKGKLGKKGAMYTGWKTIGKNKFYFNPKGKLGKKGAMYTGWKTINKKKFYFNPKGKAGSQGAMSTGWKTIGNNKYYFMPTGKNGIKGKMLVGMQTIGGYKYYFNNSGVLQKNGPVGTQQIGYYYADSSGKIDLTVRKTIVHNGKQWLVLNGKATMVTTKEDLTLYRALNVVNKITNDSMTKSQKLKASFDYVKKAYIELNPRIPHYHGMDWPVIYANDMFVDGAGNCFSYAAAFAYMAKAIGYENVYCCHSGGHGWAEIDGLVYDPEWSKHYSYSTYYALSYDTKVDQNYKGAIAAGYPWMHIKI